ncbi:unnamed protein product, partial [Nesidiocoris tenuis]
MYDPNPRDGRPSMSGGEDGLGGETHRIVTPSPSSGSLARLSSLSKQPLRRARSSNSTSDLRRK